MLHDKILFQYSEPMTMYRSLDITYKPLEAGVYYLDYWVEDIFMRHLPVGRAEVLWNGKTVDVSLRSKWNGGMKLTVADR